MRAHEKWVAVRAGDWCEGLERRQMLAAVAAGPEVRAVVPPPAAPTVLRVLPRARQAVLSFVDNAIDETGFVIERSVDGGAFVEAGRVPPTPAGDSGAFLRFVDAGAAPGQTIAYRVRAAGTPAPNGSGDSETVAAAPVRIMNPGGGLQKLIFDDVDFTGSEAVPEPVTYNDQVPDEYFGLGSPDPSIDPDQFSIIYRGTFYAEVTGTYRFGLSSDAGSSLYLGDSETYEPRIRLENLGARRAADFRSPQDVTGPAYLVRGLAYPIEVRLVEDSGAAGIRLFQSIEGEPFEPVPRTAFTPVNRFDRAPLRLQASALCDERVTLEWVYGFYEVGFEIERSSSPDGPFSRIGTAAVGAESFQDRSGPLTPGIPYYYRVVASDEWHSVSNIVSATPYDGLTETRTDLTLRGSARFVSAPADADGVTLQLTGNRIISEVGGAFFTYARDVNRDKLYTFSFQILGGNGADGFAFVIQGNSPNALGNGLGYEFIPNSLAIKFDVYGGEDNDSFSQTGVYLNGAMDDSGAEIGFNLDDGSIYDVTIAYNADGADDDLGGTPIGTDYDAVTVRIADRSDPTTVFLRTFREDVRGNPFDIDQVLGTDGCGYVGFTGTSSLYAEQNILDVNIDDFVVPPPLRPPAVTQVFVKGAGLTGVETPGRAAFRARAGIDPVYGYPVPGGAGQLRSIPWTGGVDQIAIRFSADLPAHLIESDLTVRGVNRDRHEITGFRYDRDTRTGVWNLSTPVFNDKIRLFLDDAVVVGLDGEWDNPSSSSATTGHAYPSGDGKPGGDFDFRVNVLRGDATGNGTVNAQDLAFVKQRLNATATSSIAGAARYDVFADLTADGVINAQDLSATKLRLNNQVPIPEPATALLSRSAAGPR